MFAAVMRRVPALLLATALAACASVATQPQPARLGLRLAPGALGASIGVQQHLSIERDGRSNELDAALEVDSERLDLVGLALGQRVLSLHLDASGLQSWRHPMLPAQVRAEDVLEDLQLALWPAAAIRDALPPDWRLEDEGLRRTLFFGAAPVAVIEYASLPLWSGTIRFANLPYRYRLTIQSVAAAP